MRYFVLLCLVAFTTALHAQVVVVNAASFRSNQPVAPGSWVSAFNSNVGFPNISEAKSTALPEPRTLAGVSITVDSIPAALEYVSSDHINFIIPNAVSPGIQSISITTPTDTYQGSIQIINSAPGIFPNSGAEPPQGAILNEDFSQNSSSKPAIRGQVIQIYATGAGAFDQTLEDGTATPASPLINSEALPQVYIGGAEAHVEFSGLAPNFVNLWQINARIPADATFLTDQVPLQVFINGVDSNEVTLFVPQ